MASTTIMDATIVADAMARITKLRPDKAQWCRSSDTLKFFRTGEMKMKGEDYHIKAFTQPLTNVRAVGDAVTVETTEWPDSRQIDHTDVEVDWDDLYEFRGTIQYTGLAAQKTKDRRAAIYRTAQRLLGEAEDDMGAALNMKIHQDANCQMGLVAAKYSATTGDTYSQNATAFVQVDNGSISQFQPGMYVDIHSASTATVRFTAKIDDVYKTSVGANGVADIGPGFTATRTSGTDSDFDNVADNDMITLSDEAASTNFQSFGVWFDREAAVFSLTRDTTVGEQWAIPYVFDYQSAGADVALDLDTHLRGMTEELAYAVRFGRNARKREGVKITEAALTLLGTPRLVSYASTQVGDAVRYTTDLEGADRKKYFGTSGFDGAYWHNPVLGKPISFATDPVATPSRLRLIEPSSWQWIIGHTGNHETVEWLDKDGNGRWYYLLGSNYRRKNVLAAGYFTRLALMCDQPMANVEARGLKSDLE